MAEELVQKALERCRIAADKIWSRIISTEAKFKSVHLSDAVLSSVIGGITFPFCLGVLQTGIFRPLRISSNLRLIGPVCGCLSLFISGATASLAFLSSVLLLKEIKDSPHKVLTEKLEGYVPNEYSLAISVCHTDAPLHGFGSLIVFKILGGKFRSVLPSSLIHPGAFAKSYIPAKGLNYASASVKKKLTLLGRKYGCHSCGKRWRTSFVGDHMPPNKLVRKGQQQRFYPQCYKCSNLQGAALSSMSRLQRIKTHGSSLRLYHLWLPLPVPLAMLRKHINEISNAQDSGKGSDTEEQNQDCKTDSALFETKDKR